MLEQQWQENGEARFYILDGEKRLAFMDLLQTESAKLVIKHTEVEPEYEGQGLGRKLLEAVAAYSREKGLTILPVCPFARNLMERDPDKYRDLC